MTEFDSPPLDPRSVARKVLATEPVSRVEIVALLHLGDRLRDYLSGEALDAFRRQIEIINQGPSEATVRGLDRLARDVLAAAEAIEAEGERI